MRPEQISIEDALLDAEIEFNRRKEEDKKRPAMIDFATPPVDLAPMRKIMDKASRSLSMGLQEGEYGRVVESKGSLSKASDKVASVAVNSIVRTVLEGAFTLTEGAYAYVKKKIRREKQEIPPQDPKPYRRYN